MARVIVVVPRDENKKIKTILNEDDVIGKNVIFDAQHAIKNQFVNGVSDFIEEKKGFKIREKRIAIRKVLQDYTNCSSVHGVQYLGNLAMKIGYLGKFVWLCVMIAGFVCLTLMVKKFWKRFDYNPTKIYVETFYHPLFTAPFPAVTSCPFVPSLLRTRLKLMKTLKFPSNMSSEDQMFYLKYGSDISGAAIPGREEYFKGYEKILEANNLQLVEFLRLIRPCDDLFQSCWWHDREINCTANLTLTYSSKGLCCSFNYLLEDYIKVGSNEQKPEAVHTSVHGQQSGLTLVFRPELFLDDDGTGPVEKVSTNTIGILVFSHHHMDYPGDNYPIFFLQGGQELHISVAPEYRQKPANVYHFRKDSGMMDLECILGNERTLQYFPVYRYKNCYTDCKIEMTYRLCKCIPHYYTPVAEKRNIRTCQLKDFACLDYYANAIRIVKDRYDYERNFTCVCRNPCSHMIYEEKSTIMRLDATKFSTSPIYRNVSAEHAILKVYMEESVYMRWKTRPAANELDFLASVGGLFSLFLGCSFLSAVEIFYFLFLLFRSLSHK